jgi:hypothetical protein
MSKCLSQVSPPILHFQSLFLILVRTIRAVNLGLDLICSNCPGSQLLKIVSAQLKNIATGIVGVEECANTGVKSNHSLGAWWANVPFNGHRHAKVALALEHYQTALVIEHLRKGSPITGGLQLGGIKYLRLECLDIVFTNFPGDCCKKQKGGKRERIMKIC